MNNLNKSRELLKKYFKETSKEILNQKFEKFNQDEFEGQSITDYLTSFASQYLVFDNKYKEPATETTWVTSVFAGEKSEKIISNSSSIYIKTDSNLEFNTYNSYFGQAA